MTARSVAGAFLALLGAVGVTASAYLSWFSDRTPETVPIDWLFQSGVTGEASSYWTSVALPLAIVTFVAVIGVILRSRLVLAVGWLIGLATLVLFIIQAVNDAADFAIGDLQSGVWVAIAGLLVMLLGWTTMGGRPAPEAEEPEPVSVEDRGAAGGGYAADTTDRTAAPAPEPTADETRVGEEPRSEERETAQTSDGIEPPPEPDAPPRGEYGDKEPPRRT